MANKRVTELTAIDGDDVANDDLLMIVDVSDSTMAATGTNKKITVAEFATDSTLGGAFVAKSTLTTDGDMLTRASGVPDRITRADLAQDSAFSSRYVSKSDEEYRWLGAGDMVPVSNLASLGWVGVLYGNDPVWRLDSGILEYLSCSAILPDYWTTFKVELYWTNVAASSGDVSVRLYGNFAGASDTPHGNSALSSSQTLTAPVTAGPATVSQFPAASNVTNVAGKPFFLSIGRNGADAADTLANDMGVYGVLLTRMS